METNRNVLILLKRLDITSNSHDMRDERESCRERESESKVGSELVPRVCGRFCRRGQLTNVTLSKLGERTLDGGMTYVAMPLV